MPDHRDLRRRIERLEENVPVPKPRDPEVTRTYARLLVRAIRMCGLEPAEYVVAMQGADSLATRELETQLLMLATVGDIDENLPNPGCPLQLKRVKNGWRLIGTGDD